MNLYLSEAYVLPEEIAEAVDTIAADAEAAAFAVIAVEFEALGFPITGDVSPSEDVQIREAFHAFVRMMAINNPEVAALQDQEDETFYVPPDDLEGTVFDPRDETFGPIMGALQAGEFEEAARLVAALTSDRFPSPVRARARAIGEEFSESEEQTRKINALNAGPGEYVITTTPDDPSLDPIWVSHGTGPIDVLDQWADSIEMARYSDVLTDTSLTPEERDVAGVDDQGRVFGIFSNGWVYVLPTGN